jgi:ankyrin repeat protein
MIKISVLLLFLLASGSLWAADLHEAAERADLSTLKAQIKTKAQANARNAAGESLLIVAAGIDQAKVLQFLLAKGADINAKDNDGKTALFYAVSAGLEKNAILLIEKKADLSIQYGEKKESILFEAVRQGQMKTIKAIANKDRSLLEMTNTDHETPIFEAVRAAQSVSAEALIAAGAKRDAKNKDGKTAADLADPTMDTKILKILKKK